MISLALGIGANTAIFTLINSLMLKALPVRDAQKLVAFGKGNNGGAVDGIGPGPLDIFPYDSTGSSRKSTSRFRMYVRSQVFR